MGYKNDQYERVCIKDKDTTSNLRAVILELKKEIELLKVELKRKNIID